MKKRFTLFLCMVVLPSGLFAQAGFSYQAVLRHADGTLRANESMNLTAEMIQNEAVVYSETHATQTNNHGAFTITIGQGATGQTYTPSLFLNSDSTGILQTVLRISESGGNVLSETSILGVPFAEVAKVALKAHVDFPAGVIFPFAGPADQIPAGWMLCNGAALNKADYPELYEAIKTNWGEPGPDTFNLPDLRGTFLRGVNGSSDDAFADPDTTLRQARHSGGAIGNKPGSYQTDAFESHNHEWIWGYEGDDDGYGGSYNEFTFRNNNRVENSPMQKTGGKETRPSNAYVNYIIKY